MNKWSAISAYLLLLLLQIRNAQRDTTPDARHDLTSDNDTFSEKNQ